MSAIRPAFGASIGALIFILALHFGVVQANEPATDSGALQPFNDLVDLSGKPVSEAASVGNGKWTLVMVWATDCSICRQQKPLISAFHNKHKDTDAHVFGIALDGRAAMDEVQEYVDAHDVSFPTFVGELVIVASSVQSIVEEPLRGTPTYLLFDPTGEIKGVNPGPMSIEALEGFINKNSG